MTWYYILTALLIIAAFCVCGRQGTWSDPPEWRDMP